MLPHSRGRSQSSLRSLLNLTLDTFESYCFNNRKWLLWVGLTLYLASRVCVFYLMIGGDVKFYAQYGYEARAAHSANATIYQKFYSDQNINRTIEYPPLTIDLFFLISLFIPATVDSTHFYISFNRLFHGLLFLVDLAIFGFLLVYLFSRKVSASAILVSAANYTLTGFILGHILYSRLDLVLGELIIVAIILMISSRRLELVSVAVLSLAIAFKLVPILLLPIWLIGGLSSSHANWFRITLELIKKGALFGAIIALPWIFFAFRLGEDAFLFLEVHQVRGIHIESLWGAVAVLLSKLGLFAVRVTGFRSIDVAFSLSSAFETVSVALLLAGCSVVYLIYGYKAFSLLTTKPMRSATISQEEPALFKLAILACLVLSLAVSKVLSPQYLLWFVPIALLIPWEPTWGKLSHLMLLSLACLTTLIVPLFYVSDVLQMTWFGVALLSVRNIGMVVWAGILLFHLARYRAEGRCLSVPNHL